MRIVICDDEDSEIKKIRAHISKAIDRCGIPVTFVEYNNPTAMLFAMDKDDPSTWPDLVCIDVSMPRVSGVDAVREMRSKGIHIPVVFFGMVAEVKTFLEAFDLRAVSYFITASIDDSRLCRVLMDVKEIIEERRWEAVAFSCAGEIRNIPVRDIEYFEVHGRIITVHYDGKTFDFYSQLSNIEELMRGRGFVRTHRAYLVAVRAIEEISGRNIQLVRGERIPLSRRYAPSVRGAIGAVITS